MQFKQAKLECECGSTHSIDVADSTIRCECGTAYVVTISQFDDPE